MQLLHILLILGTAAQALALPVQPSSSASSRYYGPKQLMPAPPTEIGDAVAVGEGYGMFTEGEIEGEEGTGYKEGGDKVVQKRNGFTSWLKKLFTPGRRNWRTTPKREVTTGWSEAGEEGVQKRGFWSLVGDAVERVEDKISPHFDICSTQFCQDIKNENH